MISPPHSFREHGFTLIELLMVTMIICVLTAILFPVFTRAQEKGDIAKCNHNLKELGLALHMYAYEAGSRLPPQDGDFAALDPFLPDRRVLACPTVTLKLAGDLDKAAAVSYQFKGGLTTDQLPTLVVADEQTKTLHAGGANYLFLDGHVKWLKAGSRLRRSSGAGTHGNQSRPTPKLGESYTRW